MTTPTRVVRPRLDRRPGIESKRAGFQNPILAPLPAPRSPLPTSSPSRAHPEPIPFPLCAIVATPFSQWLFLKRREPAKVAVIVSDDYAVLNVFRCHGILSWSFCPASPLRRRQRRATHASECTAYVMRIKMLGSADAARIAGARLTATVMSATTKEPVRNASRCTVPTVSSCIPMSLAWR